MNQISRQYHLFDAKGKILGRLSTEIARILSGKNRVDFTPNIDAGDFVVVTNVEKIEVTGKKESDKTYYRFSGYPGGIYARTVSEQREKDARKILEKAVFGMLPKNKLRAPRMKRLRLYIGDTHPHKTIHVDHNTQTHADRK